MITVRWDRPIVAFVVALGLLAGCAAPAPPTPSAAAAAAPSRAEKSSPLLYTVSVAKGSTGYYDALSAYDFPSGKLRSTIRLGGAATGLCSDAAGNVWVVVEANKRFDAYEYPHGGTTPIATLHIEKSGGSVGDCAVDPTTGDLAVMTGFFGGSSVTTKAEIWRGARGKPTFYPIDFEPNACAYDGAGDLFVDGYVGSTVAFELAELVKGGSSFGPRIGLNKAGGFYPGGLAWDGTYLDIAMRGSAQAKPALYRLSVHGSKVHFVDTVELNRLWFMAFVAFQGGLVAGMSGESGQSVSTWLYPQGGKVVTKIAHYDYQPRGVTISVAK